MSSKILISNNKVILSNGSIVLVNNSRLPNEYQEVEHLEATGTQYIDTKMTMPKNGVGNLLVETQFMLCTNSTSDNCVGGGRISGSWNGWKFPNLCDGNMETLGYMTVKDMSKNEDFIYNVVKPYEKQKFTAVCTPSNVQFYVDDVPKLSGVRRNNVTYSGTLYMFAFINGSSIC